MKAVKVKTSQRVMAWGLVWLTGLQPLLPAWAAGVTVASGNTALEAAGNGVPVVNIATPDAAGLSHNRYHDFNIDNRGLILNNGTAQLTPSQLGGLLQNNPNLNGRAASAILNEVVSPNRSRLAGYLEVAGPAATVVVANPYGITCSGCGFLNTPRLTLTTGTPRFDAAGGLSGLDVRGGDILIDGAGLDASQSDYFALIARTASLQAGLSARDARVVLGANRVDTAGGVTAQAGEGLAPALALDTGALGGMYANRISLVSTEQGVGVNTAGLSARQGDIQLSANGRLQVGSAIAQGELTAQGGTLALQGSQQAQGAMTLRGAQGVTLTGSRTRAGQGLTLTSDGRITAAGGQLSAGVRDDGAVQPGYGLTVSGADLMLGQAALTGDRVSLTASGAVSQTAGGAWQAGSALTLSGGALTLDGEAGAQTVTVSGRTLRNGGDLRATEGLTLDLSGALGNTGTLAGQTLTAGAASLDNGGTLLGVDGLTLTLAGNARNQASGQWLSGGRTALTASSLDNRGTVSGRQVSVQTPQLSNGGTLSADETLSVQARTGLDNGGSLLSGGELTVRAGQTVNRGVMAGGALSVTADGLENDGEWQAGNLLLTAGSLRNGGRIQSDGALTATLSAAGTLTNSGTLAANGDTTLTLGGLDNRGTVSALGGLTVQGSTLGNAGQLASRGALTLTGDYAGGGSLYSEAALTLSGNGVVGDGGRWQAKTVTVTGDTLSNGGQLNAAEALTLQLDGALGNTGTLAGQTLMARAAELDNSGLLSGRDGLTLTLPGTLTNRGRLEGQTLSVTADSLDNGGTLLGMDALTLAIAGTARNQASGQWLSQGESRLTAGTLDNQGQWQGDSLTATADRIRNAGQLLGLSALTLTADGTLSNAGTGQLLTQGAAVLRAATAENDGEWQAGNLRLTADSLRNGGRIQSDGALTVALSPAGVLTNTGTLAANGDTTLTPGGLDNRGAVSVRGDLTVTGTDLDNAGQLAARGALTLTGSYAGAGSLYSDAALTLRGTTLANDGGRWQGHTVAIGGGQLTNTGTVTGLDALTVTTTGTLTNHGRLEGQTLSLTADALDNDGTLLGVDALTLAIAGTARNQTSGQWLSNGESRLTAAMLDNQGRWQGDRLHATAGTAHNAGQLLGLSALTLTAGGALTNTATGKLLTQGAALLNAATAENDGEWQAGILLLTADGLRNGGQIHSDGDLAVTLPATGSDPLRAMLRAVQQLAQDVQAASPGSLTNTGTLTAGGDSRITGRRLDNQGTLAAGGALTLTAGDMTNAGRLDSRTLLLTGDSLDNGGTLLAEQGGVLTLGGGLRVGADGRLLSNGDWQVQAGTVTSLGQWQGNNLLLGAASLDNGGALLGTDAVTLTLSQGYTGGAGSQVLGNGAVTVTADTVTQQGDIGGDRLWLTTGTLTNGGRLVGLSQLDVTSRGQLTNRATGSLLGNGTAGVTAATLDNAGSVQADRLTLTADAVDNGGRVQGTSALTLNGVSRYTGTDGSQLLSGGTATLAIDNADNAGLWQAGELRFRGASLTSRGQITGQDSLTVDAASLTSTGQLTTRGLATLRGQRFDNGGTLTALGGFTARFSDSVTNQGGGQLLSGGTGSLTTGTLDNRGRWQSDRLTLTADTLRNPGTLLGLDDGSIQLTGAYVGEAGSQVGSNGAFSLTAATIDQAGHLQARDVTLRATRLRNQGSITGSGQLTATLDAQLENLAGATLLGGTVWLGGATVSNGGQIQGRSGLTVQGGTLLDNQSGGQLLSGGQLTLNATQLTNAGWVQGQDLTLTTAQLDNGGTLQAQSGLTLHLPQWTNRGTVQAGQLDITTDGQLENRGTLLGLTRLALQAASLNNADGARLYSAGELQLRTGQLVQDGQLAALGDLRADIGNPFTFTRTLAAGGQLTLNVTGDLVQAGTLQGHGVTVTSTGTLTQQGRIVAGGGNSLLSAAAISQTESGSIQGGGPLSLRATGDITNRGFVGTAGDLLVQAGGVMENGSLLYGGGDLRLLSSALVNRFGNILAGNSLWIQRDGAGNASSSVLNSSGTIETQRGDITVRTGTLTNQREGLVVTESSSSAADMPSWAGGTEVTIPVSWFKDGELGIGEYIYEYGCRKNDCSGRTFHVLVPKEEATLQKVVLSDKMVSVSVQGDVAKINAASNIYLNADALLNDASLIYAQHNMLLTGGSLNNKTYQSGALKQYFTYQYAGVDFWAGGIKRTVNLLAEKDQTVYIKLERESRNRNNDDSDYDYIRYYSSNNRDTDWVERFNLDNGSLKFTLAGEPVYERANGQTYAATIQAGGAITASFSQNISNTSLQPGRGGFMPAMATPTLAGVNALTPVGAQADRGLNGGTAGNVSGSALSGAGAGVALAGQAGRLNAGYSTVTRDNSTSSSGSALNPVGIPAGLGTAGGAPVAGASLTPVAPGALSLSDLQAALAQGLQQLGSPSLTDYPLPTSQNGLFVADTAGDSRYLIRTNPTLSQLGQVDNALFGDLRGLLGQTPGTTAPVERSATLTDPTQVLGSSYLLGKLNLDAEHDYRFLGDAAFDTRYISNAVLSQTGQRYLNGVGSELAQMQQLMDAAAAEKSRLNLQLGVSLTPEQVAGLSHSLVWWENITVGGQTVLAPKLYLAQADKTNLQGSRIVANSVSLSAGGDIDNRGSTITAQDVLSIASGGNLSNREGGLLNAGGALNLVALGNLTNSSATIQGNTVTLASVGGDIVNTTTTDQWQTAARDGRGRGSLTRTDIGQAGLITAQGGLTLQAGHDIALNGAQLSAGGPLQLAAGNDIRLTALTTVTDTVSQTGGATTERRSQGLVQSTVASGGDLSLSAGRDLSSTAAQLSAAGTLGLSAGRDLSLLSAGEEQFSSNAWNRHLDWQQTVTQQGTVLNAGEGLSLRAGQDLTLQGAQAETRGALTAQAGRDLSLLSATESRHDFFEETTVKKGFLSKTTTHTLRDTQQTTEKGTLLSGGSVALTAGQDIGVQGSAVAADGEVTLTAGHDITTAASVETYRNYEEHSRKKSGVFSGGGIGFTIGSTSMSQKQDDKATTQSQSVSTLGSTSGSVRLNAGQAVSMAATDVIAARDIQVTGNSVTIDPGYDTRKQSRQMEQKTAGLTVTLSGVVGSALNSAVQTVQAVREQSDSRLQALQALQGMKAVLSGYQAYQGTQIDTNNQGASSFVGISVSLGAQRSSSSQTSEQSQSFASTLNAGHDISVVARQGDITAVGSQLKAANNVELNASRAINLLSARNTESMTGSNSSSGGNIGVSFGLSNSGAGFSVFANVNAAKGRELGNGNSWSETTVDAGQQIALTSGGDTRLTGAQVSGERIVANVGGDLLLKSQQDSNRYDSKQTSVSAGGSFTFGSMTGSGYLSASQDKMHSSFDSVQQQTGLFAGKGGYDISVGNHTQLDGAVIGSTAAADKNRLDTGTLGFSNIDNRAEFSVSHSGIGLSASPSLSMSDMLKSAALTAPSALMSMGRGGNAGSTTYAAVSDGALIIRNQAGQQQDIAGLSRDVEHANNALSPIFDKEKEQKRLQTAQMVGELGAQVMDVVRTEGEIRAVRAAEAKGDVKRPADNASEKDWDKYKKDLTETPAYKAVMQSYGTGSDLQRATQAATAAIQALAGGGNLQQALAGASAPYLAQLVKGVTMPADESKATASDIAANAMGHALMGAVVAQLSGKDAVAGAVGAAGGELTARLLIMKELYSGRDTRDLTEAEKQSVSALASLAAGLASGIASGNTAGAATGAQAGRNAVENNYLSATEAQTKDDLERKEKAGTLTADEAKELADTRKLDKDRDQAIHDICTQGNKSGGACSALVAKAQQALNSYGESAASYRLIYKDLYPQDAANASAILKGLDEGSITRDAAITAIAKSTGKGWDEVASQYDTAMQLHGIVSTLAGFYGANSVSQSAEATNTAMSMADRIKANIAESQQARESSNFGIHIAKSDQIQWGYAADEWGMVTLPAGSKVYGGIPGQSSYYTSWDTLLNAGFSRESIFKSLQVLPHTEFGYRPQMGIYEVVNDITIPSGQVMANPLLGPGGGTQYFIKDYGNQLKLIDKIDLGK
ncbi:hemagglutinin repeat-containing protein [Dickeya dadantii]|uniref:hemagglutinin repeat-containing protein n=3 Tax=Dickeya dadantii TaxID=204038 RepID=UPI0021DB4861|nr:hemagglutinin repeat-containing protein [Dickeya dadantii]